MFSLLPDRVSHSSELDTYVEAWTRNLTAHQVMRLLQGEVIPAGVVQTSEDMYYDMHMRDRGFIVQIEQDEIEGAEYPGLIVRLANSPGIVTRCPERGENNGYVFTSLLNMSETEIQELSKKRVIA